MNKPLNHYIETHYSYNKLTIYMNFWTYKYKNVNSIEQKKRKKLHHTSNSI